MSWMENNMVEEKPDGAGAGRNRGKVTDVETYGIERIPEKDRNASAFDLFRVSFGGANTFATAFLGAFPILFGLSFWQGLAATAPSFWRPWPSSAPRTEPTTRCPPPPTWACTAGWSDHSCHC